jgi:hypothetical protein
MNKKLILASAGAFVVGFFIAWLVFGGSGTANDAAGKNEDTASPLTENTFVPFSGTASITAVNQKPGRTASVSSAETDKESWIAIHEDREGKPGNILGAKKIGVGATQNIEVSLLREMKDGGTYYAMLHAEDGDGSFDYKKDTPLLDSEGNPIMISFVASLSATEK